jgi:hypothetical protein
MPVSRFAIPIDQKIWRGGLLNIIQQACNALSLIATLAPEMPLSAFT